MTDLPPALSPKRMKASDVPERPVLEFLAWCRGQYDTDFINVPTATIFAGYANSVGNGMPPDTPEKVALAKMRSLIRRGLVDGCGCGCRGDFTLTSKGLALLGLPPLEGG